MSGLNTKDTVITIIGELCGVVVTVLVILFILFVCALVNDTHTKVNYLIERIDYLETELQNTTIQDQELRNKLQEWLDEWEVETGEITGYAPLDTDARAGMCYEGDPSVTASGAEVVPGVTVAAGPPVPFGTRVFIGGLGWRVVQDRGGMISRGKWDVAMETRQEALRFGRQKLKVIYEKGK